MAATIITLSAIGAGTQIFNAWQQSRAAKKAAETQQAGVREARAYAEPLYQQAQAGFAPYQQQGQQGLTALSALLGLPKGAPAAAPPAAPTTGVNPAWEYQDPRTGTFHAGDPADPAFRGNIRYNGQVMSDELARERMAADRAGRPPTPFPGTTGSASSYVTLRAPTGEIKAVPADQASAYLARGATRVQ